ncbi:MAG: hypothetical protein ACM3X4_03415 [Ignavibacteriales bacterium]
MVDREVQLAHKIRETCQRMRPENPALKRDVIELIEKIDRFLECVADASRDTGPPHDVT